MAELAEHSPFASRTKFVHRSTIGSWKHGLRLVEPSGAVNL
jgi:hypothetical protein